MPLPHAGAVQPGVGSPETPVFELHAVASAWITAQAGLVNGTPFARVVMLIRALLPHVWPSGSMAAHQKQKVPQLGTKKLVSNWYQSRICPQLHPLPEKISAA